MIRQNQTSQKREIRKKKDQWSTVKLNVDGQSIWIFADEDSCFFKENRDDTIVRKTVLIPKPMRDSIFTLVKDAIINYEVSEEYYSCYAGQYVELILVTSNGSISCNYASIPNWTDVSPTLKKLSQITFDRYKIPQIDRAYNN